MHSRDSFIHFDEASHTYTVIGDEGNRRLSTTTFVKLFFPPFDADSTIERMIQSGTFNTKYPNQTPEQVKQQWKTCGQQAAKDGTCLHAYIEEYMLSCIERQEWIEVLPASPLGMEIEVDQLRQCIHQTLIPSGLVPYRSEWRVYTDAPLYLAGSIDMVFKCPDGSIAIYDWKRTKELKRRGFNDSRAFAPIHHLDDCNFVHYALQLNVYAYILERYYNYTVSELALVIIHPNKRAAQVVSLPRMTADIDKMIVRLNELTDPTEFTTQAQRILEYLTAAL